MRQIKWIICLCLLGLLTACMSQDPTYEPTKNQDLELTKLSTKGVTDQQPADEAKQYLSQYEEVSGLRAVNHEEQLLVAIDIDHDDRFALDSLESKLRKKLHENFPNMEIHLSTDQKLLFELEKLEQEIANESIAKKEIGKRMKKLKKLMKEQT